MLKDYVTNLHPRIETLLEFHTRPLTVIYEGCRLPQICEASSGGFAVRVACDNFCKELIGRFGKPIIASSANVIGAAYPANFGEIRSDILSGVNYVVKWKQGEKKRKEPSVIVRLAENEELEFLRN